MPSEIQVIAGKIRQVARNVASMAQNVHQRADRLDRRRREVEAMLRGSRNPNVAALIAALAQAVTALRAAAAPLAALAPRLEYFAAHLAPAGDAAPALPSGTASDASTTTGQPQALTSEDEDDPYAPVTEPIPDFIANGAPTLRAMLPRGKKTVGQVFTEDGTAWGPEIWSGISGPGENAPGVRTDSRDPKYHELAPILHHVEGHTAALMRRLNAPRRVTLLVSRDPCGGEYGCDTMIPRVLPKGSQITVYVALENGTVRRWKNRFTGNGEGLQP